MRKIAIFGASGGTGQLLTAMSLAAGHSVSALVRVPERFAQRERVRVIEGTAFDPEAVAETLAGADLVFSALGARSWRREDVLERAVPLIVAAMAAGMEKGGPRRLIALGSAGARPDALDKQPAWRRRLVERIVYRTFLKWPVADQIAQWKALSASRLEWTMVMPPMLTSGPAKGRYRIDGEVLPRHGNRIARADVAAFMFAQIDSPAWVRKGVYVTD